MSYFLRNLNPFSSTDASIQIDSYSNHSARFIDQSSVCNNRRTQQNDLAGAKSVCSQFAQLLRYCAKLPPRGQLLRLSSQRKALPPSADSDGTTFLASLNNFLHITVSSQELAISQFSFLKHFFLSDDGMNSRRIVVVGANSDGVTSHEFEAASFDTTTCLRIVAAPSAFGATVIARTFVLRYAALLKITLCCMENALEDGFINEVELDIKDSTLENHLLNKGDQVVLISLKCLFSILAELSKRDPELCSDALGSLLKLLEQLNPDALSTELHSAVRSMHEILKQLRIEGSSEVSSKATSCLIALATAYGMPEFLLSSVASLLCDTTKSELKNEPLPITIPSNHHKLANLVQRIIISKSENGGSIGDWWSNCLHNYVLLSAFEVRIPSDITPETPDDRRLTGSVASDGRYIYVLTCHGLLKFGTGLAETIAGKLYASNAMLKANKGTWLAICNGSLYLRRRQSSRLWVIDVDTLREIGEIMLHSAAVTGALVTDGSTFYQANFDEQWNLLIIPLDDSFTPTSDQKQCQKYRLCEIGYTAVGDCHPLPHELPLSLPKTLQAQASDLQMGREVAFLLARTGKVYYAGNGARLGLQDTGSNWMELVLPDSIVSMSVGTDTETVVLRSGSGHVWISGLGPEIYSQSSPATARFQKVDAGLTPAKLRKFHISNRRKCISVALSSGCIAYVIDNGKAYVSGRHAMHCNPETGQILGLEGVNLVSIALGKTHAAAITRHGQLFTWGLNNLCQCGRAEVVSLSNPRISGAHQMSLSHTEVADDNERTEYCTLNEHLWVKDFASICAKCGECSARGNKCFFAGSRRDMQKVKKGTLCKCGEGETCCLRCGLCRVCGERLAEEMLQNDEERLGTSQRTFLPPARLVLQKFLPDTKISSVSCGNYHTIVLAADRQVFSFGSNCHGQLGVGDTKRYVGPQKVELPMNVQVVQVATGANHSVLRTADGSVITFGAYRQGQLARSAEECTESVKVWHATPSFVKGYGRGCGTVATWVGANGDITLIHSQKRIFSSDIISNCQIVANKDAIIIFPNEVGKDYVAIRRKFNSFYRHSLGPAGLYTSWYLESKYNLMWTFNAAEMRIQSYCNSLVTDAVVTDKKREVIWNEISLLKAPEYFLPVEPDSQLSASHMALSVLCSTFVITMLVSSLSDDDRVAKLDSKSSVIAQGNNGYESRVSYQTVNRFDAYGGGWGYSVHSVEAIQFRASRDIKFLGVGLFGGRGEYIAKLKLFRLTEAEFDEQSIELIAESDEMLFECAAREKAHLMFARAVSIKANHWHVICAQINGPSSDCGASGKTNVTAEDGVHFSFRNSRMSNNGTDINVGQIPELLYVSEISGSASTKVNKEQSYDGDISDSNKISAVIRMKSLIKFSPNTLSYLFEILEWSVQQALVVKETDYCEEISWKREKATAIAIICLKLACFYVRCLYSLSSEKTTEKRTEPSFEFNNLMVQLNTIMNMLFELSNDQLFNENSAGLALLEESVRTYVLCSHVLLPSQAMILSRLAYLMSTPNREWSLVALLSALCHQDYVLPILLWTNQDFQSNMFSELSKKMNEEMLKTSLGNKPQRLTNFQNILRFLFEIAFAHHNAENSELTTSGLLLRSAARTLIVTIAKELVTPKDSTSNCPPIMQSPNRFRRTMTHPTWDVTSGAADAISIKVDVSGVILHGIGVYCADHDQQYFYTCEILLNNGDAAHEQWNVLEKFSGTLVSNQPNSTMKEIAMLKLSKTISMQPGMVYAVRLNITGGKTFCGEGGVGTVRLCNGVRLQFQPCSLSLNGTSLARGQIPFVLYSIKESEAKSIQQIADNEKLSNWFLLLIRMLSAKISDLLAARLLKTNERMACSSIAGYIMVFLELNPRRALDVISALDDLIPMVSSANGERHCNEKVAGKSNSTCGSTSLQIVIESSHPYIPSKIHSQIVNFGASVHFMLVQFSEECETSQADDILWLYARLNDESYLPVGRFCGNRDWPDRMLLVPGNSLWFILETSASSEDILEKQMYGYRCTVTGFLYTDMDSNLVLEKELTWICASACRLLIQIPSDPVILDAITIAEEEIHDIIQKHGSLLRKGLNLSHIPTVNEILKRSLPASNLTPGLKFLREFIAGSSNTVAGFLASWMMNESVIDCHKSQLLIPEEDIRVGVPVLIHLVPRDQYGRLALCSSMKVEVLVRNGGADQSSVGNGAVQGRPSNPLTTLVPTLDQLCKEPFRPVYLNRARYMSITMMANFADYSFEELRFAYIRSTIFRDYVAMNLSPNGSFCGEWFPRKAGTYRIECKLDGFQLSQSYLLEVVDDIGPVSAISRPNDTSLKSKKRRIAHLSRARFAVCDQRIMSKGVRIRATPTLNALQIGIISRGHTVSYVEEIENNDGIWLRLTDEASAMHCAAQFPTQAWCLQYSKHLDRSFLLLESDETDHIESEGLQLDAKISMTVPAQNINIVDEFGEHSLLMEAKEVYIIPSGTSVALHEDPSLDSNSSETIDGSFQLEIKSDGWLHNRQGIWIRLVDFQHKYALAQDNNGQCFLQRKNSLNHHLSNGNDGEGLSPCSHKPVAQIPPRSRKEQPVKATRPSIADCCRTVFAAFLWHEKLVKDAMVCSTYLKFHPELHQCPSTQDRMDLITATPLHSLTLLWQEINNSVQRSIEQHLILPSPPSVRHFNLRPISSNIAGNNQARTTKKDDLCELCEEWHPTPVTTHMRMAHAGCGKCSGGHGYNSLGKYTSGWSGKCGDGGRPNAVWYLMCTSCRSKHMMQTPTAHQQERNRRWREFRMTAAANDVTPETVIKENANFLLDLNCSVDGDSKESSISTSGWTINLFPQTSLSPPTLRSACAQVGSGLLLQQASANEKYRSHMRTFSHASDPGPKDSLPHLLVSTCNTFACTSKIGSSPITYGNCHSGNGEFASALRRRLTDCYERRQSVEIMRSPSTALKSLLHNSKQISSGGSHNSLGNVSASLRRPVLAFVIERHDLKRIREAMATAIARAIFFSHSFRVWNWLLKLVSSESSVSDILWQYLTALTSYSPLCKWNKDGLRIATNLKLLPHPWRVCFLAGPIATKMIHQMHSFLYTLAVILQSSGVDHSLRCLCFRTWTFQLTAHEQDLLVVLCNVLATVGDVLSDPSSDQSWTQDDCDGRNARSIPCKSQQHHKCQPDVKEMEDITSYVECEASSRQAMVVCLTDGSSETFWESGEEDKNKSRTLTVHCHNEHINAVLLAVHVDNIRDEGYRTNSVTILEVEPREIRRKLYSEQLDHQFIGWIKCSIAGINTVQIIFRGSNASVRIRQLRVFGFIIKPGHIDSPINQRSPLRPSISDQLLFSSAQIDAFALFQAIAAQAFSDEFSQEEHGTLRQQVLELLFSRVQLQPLQNFVCSQMVNALEREVSSLRERMKRNYSYACGLMVMLIKICKSRQGLEVFSVQNNLLIILSELLLFAPQVVQCQVIETIECLSRLFNPKSVDCHKFVQNLLAVVAKVITLQVKDKSTHSIMSATLFTQVTDAPQHWRIDRSITVDIGRLAKQFLADISSGSINEHWALAVKTELANQVMNFSRLVSSRSKSLEAVSSGLQVSAESGVLGASRIDIIKMAKFWLSIAALSLLKDSKWLELSSVWQSLKANKDQAPEPFCDNHDDGQTLARVYCEVCQCSLCQDCFTILHLNRRNRSHEVQIVGSASGCPQVDIHEGCTRFRVSHFMVLIHSSALNGMVEFISGNTKELIEANIKSANNFGIGLSVQATTSAASRLCRFCGNQLNTSHERLIGLCGYEECKQLAAFACSKLLNCGHLCGGIRDEITCLPCLNCTKPEMRQDADDLCVVCFVDRLGGAPCILLDCGHIFHYCCVKTVLEKRWNGPRITFRFMHCPLCKKQIAHQSLNDLLAPLKVLYEDVATKARLRLEYEGLLQSPAIVSQNSEFFENPEAFAMDRYMYVQCFKCNKAYFGGESRCQQALDDSHYNPEELVCGGCSDVVGAQVCGRHGMDYLEYKCRFCCSVAVYFCFGTTHFCAACHDEFQRLMCLPKQLLPKCPVGPKGMQLEGGACPLKIQHPPTGEEFALGCGICRNLSTF